MNDDFATRFLAVVCGFRDWMYVGLAATVALLLVNLFAFPFLGDSEANRVIWELNLVVVGATLCVSLGLLWRCARFEE